MGMKHPCDTRKIGRCQCYSVVEIAQLLNRTPATVRLWIREGLKPIDQRQPYLVHGADLKEWLDRRRLTKRCPCGPGKIFCGKCRSATAPLTVRFDMIDDHSNQLIIKGHCSVCGSATNRIGLADRLDRYRDEFFGLTSGHVHISQSTKSLVNPTIQSVTNRRSSPDHRNNLPTHAELGLNSTASGEASS